MFYLQQMVQAIASQYPNIQLPTYNPPVLPQTNTAHTFLQQAAGINNNMNIDTTSNNIMN